MGLLTLSEMAPGAWEAGGYVAGLGQETVPTWRGQPTVQRTVPKAPRRRRSDRRATKCARNLAAANRRLRDANKRLAAANKRFAAANRKVRDCEKRCPPGVAEQIRRVAGASVWRKPAPARRVAARPSELRRAAQLFPARRAAIRRTYAQPTPPGFSVAEDLPGIVVLAGL